MNKASDIPLHPTDKVANFLNKRIDHLKARKSQREIAFEIGYEKPNIISMMKRGETKIPLEKVPAFARALECDAGHLYRLALEQYSPDLSNVVHEIFGNTVSHNEMAFVRYLRELTNNMDPEMNGIVKDRLADVYKRPAE